MSNVVSLAEERQRRQPEIEEEIEEIIVFTSESGTEYEFTLDLDDSLSP